MEKRVKKEALIFMVTIILFLLSLNVPSLQAQVAPGDVIDSGNWQKAADLLPPSIVQMLKTEGLKIRVAEPIRRPPNEYYAEATKKYSAKCKLEDNVAGYIAGAPFPNIDEKDPNAALKIMYNNQYRVMPDQGHNDGRFYFVTGKGTIQREAFIHQRRVYYVGRSLIPPVPNIPDKEGIVFKDLVYTYHPQDLVGVGFYQIRYKGETRDDDAWAYVPTLRRVRRMAAGTRTDAFLGSDMAAEDFYGFSGKLQEFNWKLLGKKKMLTMRETKRVAPPPTPGKAYNWLPPEDFEWRLTDVWVLESVPKSKSHPFGKRILYLDADVWGDCLFSEAYDRRGEMWKLTYMSYYWSTWKQGWCSYQCGLQTVIDFQASHGTYIPNFFEYDDAFTYKNYTVETLEKSGR